MTSFPIADSAALRLLARRAADVSCSDTELATLTAAVTLVFATAGLTLPQITRRLLEALLPAVMAPETAWPMEEGARRLAQVVCVAQQTFADAAGTRAVVARLARFA